MDRTLFVSVVRLYICIIYVSRVQKVNHFAHYISAGGGRIQVVDTKIERV